MLQQELLHRFLTGIVRSLGVWISKPPVKPYIDTSNMNQVTQQEAGQGQAPAYIKSGSPPPYTADAAARDLLAMREGDPNERIDVPFVHSHDHKSALDYLRFRNVGKVTRRVIARPMTRRLYNERYAHDQNGNFIGTGVKAPDAGLVFIPGKGTEQDLLDQVSKFAHAKQHDPRDFADGYGTTLIDGGHVGS
ncbi:uncharacterized protein EKO05_0005247 [Ascochyta rabiei]|uniref:uncharacterized protein n=1 Tax=Didymella rabiei TaxID=5454 RepID=UPI0018FF9DFE|nr:uncharacterized protein EKO05_0005247 [Ascochyta rabiei]UPX14775.1 hypothetical protein EKO05_0005247 [Ascochyta rabiei]